MLKKCKRERDDQTLNLSINLKVKPTSLNPHCLTKHATKLIYLHSVHVLNGFVYTRVTSLCTEYTEYM